MRAGLQLPRLACLVDEYAELLTGAKKADREQIETSFVRIAQMGCAAGIHLVLATQRPSRQVVTGVLKANFPGRVALRVGNRVESLVVLDQGGAQFLLDRVICCWRREALRLFGSDRFTWMKRIAGKYFAEDDRLVVSARRLRIRMPGEYGTSCAGPRRVHLRV
jgi:hypothetical protein